MLGDMDEQAIEVLRALIDSGALNMLTLSGLVLTGAFLVGLIALLVTLVLGSRTIVSLVKEIINISTKLGNQVELSRQAIEAAERRDRQEMLLIKDTNNKLDGFIEETKQMKSAFDTGWKETQNKLNGYTRKIADTLAEQLKPVVDGLHEAEQALNTVAEEITADRSTRKDTVETLQEAIRELADVGKVIQQLANSIVQRPPGGSQNDGTETLPDEETISNEEKEQDDGTI